MPASRGGRLIGPLVVISLFLPAFGQQAIPDLEREALIVFYNSTGGPSWEYRPNWLGPEGTEATWFGVTVRDGHVTAISLPGNGLKGMVPPKIADLPELEILNLTGQRPGFDHPVGIRNQISAIPPEMGSLKKLTSLGVGENELTGVPDEIGDVVALKSLDLSGNHLTALPPAIGRLTMLETLDADKNQLVSLPPDIGQLSSLIRLYVSENRLTSLPPDIGNLRHLEELAILRNSLTRVPRELGNLTALKGLNFFGNPIVELPPELGQLPNFRYISFGNISRLPTGLGALKNVEDLYVAFGLVELPAEVGEMTALREMKIRYNDRLQSLPDSLANLANLEVLDLGRNGFREIPAVIGQIPTLRSLELTDNPLTGQIPAGLGNLVLLEELVLRQDSRTDRLLTGILPPDLGKMASLKTLVLQGDFTGPIPPEFGNLVNLETLRLYGAFTSIPPEIGNLHNLTELDVRGSFRLPVVAAPFTSIPAEIGQLSNLKTLILEGSPAEVPPELGNLTSLTTLWLSADGAGIPGELGKLTALWDLRLNGGFTGPIPPQLAGIRALRTLDLSDNRLTGPVPEWLPDLANLAFLDLSNNQLQGLIPKELGRMSWLGQLNLGGNQLTGEIPGELAGLTSAHSIDLSHNQLEGNIPYEILNVDRYFVFDATSNRLSGRLPKELGDITTKWVRVRLRWNALYPVEVPVFEFIGLHHEGDFGGTQSYGPVDLAAAGMGDTVRLSWSPISYQADSGGYQILYRQREDEPWTVYGMTNSKATTFFTVTGLETGRDYYFALRTVTYPHANNRNTVVGQPGNIAWAGTTPSSETWLPLYPDGPGRYIGIGITNVSATSMQGQIQAHSSGGQAAAFPRNPAPLVLTAGRQQTAVESQIFGSLPTQPWSTRVSADRTPVTLCLLGGPGLLDGTAGVTGIHKALYFPRVYEGAEVLAGKDAVTRLNLVNPGSSPVQIRLQLAGPQIDTAGTATVRTIAPRGLVSETLAEIFGAALPVSEAYIEARVLEGDGFAGAAAVTVGEGRSLFVVPGVPPSGFNQLSAAQVATGPGISTSIRLINTDPVRRVVSLRLYTDGGDSLKASLEMAAGSLVEKDLDDLFELPDALTAASLVVSADGTGVTGDVLVHGPSLSYASAVPLAGRSARESVLGYLANGLGVFTGLAIFNPGDEATDVTIEVVSPDGSSVGTASVSLAAKGRLARQTPELVPASAGRIGGYIRVTATQPVVVQEMFADSWLEYMSTVPPSILK